MTSLSPQSQTRLEELKIAFSKIQKAQFKLKSNKSFKEPSTSKKYLLNQSKLIEWTL
jgi:hypothetical protein